MEKVLVRPIGRPPSRRRPLAWSVILGVVVVALVAGCGSNAKRAASSSPTAASGGGTASCQGTVNVGSVFSSSGEYSGYDGPGAQGAALAISQINKKGFVVNGKCYRFKLITADAKSDVPTAVAEVHQMVLSDHPVAIFGPVVSELAEPSAEFTSAHKVIEVGAAGGVATLLAPCTAGQAPSSCGQANSTLKYFLATEGDSRQSSSADSQIAILKDLKVKSVAFLWPNDATLADVRPQFLDEMKAAGVKVVYSALFPDTTSDFSPYVSKIAAQHPDLLYFGYAVTWMDPIMTLARQENAAKYFQGSNTIAPALASGSTVATNYVMTTPVVTQYGPNAAMQTFINDFQAFTHTTVTMSTQFAYVFTEYPYPFELVKAMQEAGTVSDTTAIMAKMRGSTMTTPGGVVPPMQITSFGVVDVPDSVCRLNPSAASTPAASVTIQDMTCKLYF